MAKRDGPRPLPSNFLALFFRGLAYPLEGLRFIRQHRLWSLALMPTLINVVLFVLVVVAVMVWVVPWLQGLDQALAPEAGATGFVAAVLGFLGKFVAVLLWILVPVAILVGSAVVIVLVGQAVASPFLDVLSEKVETTVLGTKPAPISVGRTLRSIIVAIADIVWTILFWLAVNIPLLLINLIPVIGSAANAVLSFSFTALLLAQEFAGLSLARELVSYPARWRVVWRNRSVSLGFGCTTMGLLLIPGLNLLLLPLSCVGGTLLYCDLEAEGRAEVEPKATHTPL